MKISNLLFSLLLCAQFSTAHAMTTAQEQAVHEALNNIIDQFKIAAKSINPVMSLEDEEELLEQAQLHIEQLEAVFGSARDRTTGAHTSYEKLIERYRARAAKRRSE